MRPVTSLASTALHENSNNEDNIDGMVRQDDDGDIKNTVDNYNVDNNKCMIWWSTCNKTSGKSIW